jgi:hypothetical protein
MYVALFLASAQAVIHGQVLRQFCSAATAPAPPRPSLGAEQLVSGLNLPTDLPWARQLLCLSMLDSSSVQVKGSLALRLLRPLAGILLQAVDHVLVRVASSIHWSMHAGQQAALCCAMQPSAIPHACTPSQ